MHDKGRTHGTISAGGRKVLAFLLSFVMVTSSVPMQAIAEAGNTATKDAATQTTQEPAKNQTAEQADASSKTTDEGQASPAATSVQTRSPR